jgi:hypothetical protein
MVALPKATDCCGLAGFVTKNGGAVELAVVCPVKAASAIGRVDVDVGTTKGATEEVDVEPVASGIDGLDVGPVPRTPSLR